MKKWYLAFSVLAVFFSCGDPSIDNPGDDQSASGGQTNTEEVFMTDGVNNFTVRDIDSLKYTYNKPIEPGLYFMPRVDRVSINLLPVESWEKLFPIHPTFVDPIHVQTTWGVAHRTEFCKISTGARPFEVTQVENGKMVFIPIDGNCSNCIMELMKKHEGGVFTLCAEEKFLSLLSEQNGEINSSGITLKVLTDEQLTFLETVFGK
jgi:hypothetical protein